jgi:hypothetical protein
MATPEQILFGALGPMQQTVAAYGQGLVDIGKAQYLAAQRQAELQREREHAEALLGARMAAEEKLRINLAEKEFKRALDLEDRRLEREKVQQKALTERAELHEKALIDRTLASTKEMSEYTEIRQRLNEISDLGVIEPPSREAGETNQDYLKRLNKALAEAQRADRYSKARRVLGLDAEIARLRSQQEALRSQAMTLAERAVDATLPQEFGTALAMTQPKTAEDLERLIAGKKVKVGGVTLGGRAMSPEEAARTLGLGGQYDELRKAKATALVGSGFGRDPREAGLAEEVRRQSLLREQLASAPGVSETLGDVKDLGNTLRRVAGFFGLNGAETSTSSESTATKPKTEEEKAAAFKAAIESAMKGAQSLSRTNNPAIFGAK